MHISAFFNIWKYFSPQKAFEQTKLAYVWAREMTFSKMTRKSQFLKVSQWYQNFNGGYLIGLGCWKHAQHSLAHSPWMSIRLQRHQLCSPDHVFSLPFWGSPLFSTLTLKKSQFWKLKLSNFKINAEFNFLNNLYKMVSSNYALKIYISRFLNILKYFSPKKPFW